MRYLKPILASTIATLAQVTFGQIVYGGEGHWWWEASLDGGATYHTGIVEVSQSQQSVLIRSMFSFPAGRSHYLGAVGLDAAVLGASRGDDITGAASGDLGPGSEGIVYRLPGILKLDGLDDPLPPGQGPSYMNIQQDPPQTFPVPSFNNPISVIDFRLLLDGTPGDRQVRGFFVQSNLTGQPTAARVYSLYQPEIHYVYLLSLVQDDLTIRVVPAAPVFSILGASGLIAARRRR